MPQDKTTYAVTGANGFIASYLIKKLLDQGFNVNCTIRSLDSVKERSSHLIALDPEGNRLKFFEADLLKDGSFAECFKGVEGVFHTASPFQIFVEDAQRDLVDPALKGTENVVKEALKSPTVKRIVVTSSVAAVRNSLKSAGEPFNENDWNTTSTLETEAYPLSKVLAEKKAWELVQNKELNTRGVRLTTVNPSFVLGPPLSDRTDSTSVVAIKEILENAHTKGLPKLRFGCVYIGDVVDAHIHAMLDDNAQGRYIVSSYDAITRQQMAEWLHEKYPHVQTATAEGGEYNPDTKIDASKVQKDFGMKLTPVRDAVLEQAEQLYKLGIVKKQQ
uniref:3-beta hydroxysteroid dehydrogenase/isomerase domain-containing protein n=1 Tax=Percolomonas cosmopolitus TaxID=63605 RepID=A0A7S1KM56_9EUKA